jgi:AsmA protein
VRQRSATIVLCVLTGLLSLSFVPLLPTFGGPEQAGLAVQAAARDIYNIEQPVILSTAPLLKLERGRLTVDATRRQGAAARLVLDNPVFLLQQGAARNAVAMFGPEAISPLAAQLAALGFESVSLRQGTLRIARPDGGSQSIENINIEVTAGTRGQLDARGQVTYRGEILSLDGTVGAGLDNSSVGGARAADSDTLPGQRSVRVSLKSTRLGEVGFDGHLPSRGALQLIGTLDARLVSLSGIASWLGSPVRALPAFDTAAVTAQMVWADGLVGLQRVSAAFDNQVPATGAVTIKMSNGRPRVDGTLAFADLDLATYWPTTGLADGQAETWLTLPFRVPGLADFDADLRLSAARLHQAGKPLGRGAASVTVKDGMVTANIADAEWPTSKGVNRARAQLTLDMSAQAIGHGLRGRVDMADAAVVTEYLTGHLLLSGPATFTIDGRSAGETLEHVLRGFAGKITVTASTSATVLFDPFLKPLEPSEKAASLLLSAPLAIDSVDARLTVDARGVVVDQAALRIGQRIATVTGRVDRELGIVALKVSRANIPLQANKSTAARKADKSEVPSPQSFTVTGPWAQPMIVSIDGNVARP